MSFGETSEQVRENEYHDARMRIDPWIKEINDSGKVPHIEVEMGDLQNIFEFKCKAKFEISEEAQKSLGEYTNKGSRQGMEAVWGESRMAVFSSFCAEWISKFESIPGNLELPKLEKSGKKDSGMKQFFHELTLFAKGDLSLEMFKDMTETRIGNGKLWQEGKKDERKTVMTPTSEGKAIKVSSIPPGFVSDFYQWLLDSKV